MPYCCIPNNFTNDPASSCAACTGGRCVFAALHSQVAWPTHRSRFAFSLSRLPHSFSGTSAEMFDFPLFCCALPLPRQLSLHRKWRGQSEPSDFTKATSMLTGRTSLNSSSSTQRGLYDTARARGTMAGSTCNTRVSCKLPLLVSRHSVACRRGGRNSFYDERSAA